MFEQYCSEIKAPPCGIIIFGASGDLTRRKLLPALFSIYKADLLGTSFYIFGCSRTKFNDEAFRDRVKEVLLKQFGESDLSKIQEFSENCYYEAGDYQDDELYLRLSDRLSEIESSCELTENRLFYCATPPDVYRYIICALYRTELTKEADDGNGWKRVIVEKPFGFDLESSMDLDKKLLSSLKEHQIYRIDHYLGKETVQNILMLRFANAIFEPIWNSNYIDHVQILAAESIGIDHRAGYFERAGILRDMFQNHMLQLLSLVAMEPPAIFDADRVRDEKIKLIRAIRTYDTVNINNLIVRGQYSSGKIKNKEVNAYIDEKGVSEESEIETFVAAKLKIDNWRWQGVPFYFRVGKRLNQRLTEIAIVFKRVPHSIFSPFSIDSLAPNILFLTVQPKEGISIKIQAKKPGPKSCLTSVDLDFCYKDGFNIQLPDAYERLLLDCMAGDQTLFIRHDYMKLSWKLLEPILEDWSRENPGCPLFLYESGSWGPKEAFKLIEEDGRNWLLSTQE